MFSPFFIILFGKYCLENNLIVSRVSVYQL